MKQLLSLKRINENSSYPVETTGEDGFYQFFTDGGVHYSVGFMEDDILLSQNSHQLIIANINNHKSPRDHKVRDTIIAIVDEFFRNNNSTLLYIWFSRFFVGIIFYLREVLLTLHYEKRLFEHASQPRVAGSDIRLLSHLWSRTNLSRDSYQSG